MNFLNTEIPGFYRGLRVAVFGASGFIGRWVARLLSLCEAEVYLIVRDRESTIEIQTEYNFQGEIITTNLQNLQVIKQILLSVKPSIVFNLAGYGVDQSERDEHTTFGINSDLVGSICESVAESRNSQWEGQDLIHVGSALEYGNAKGNLSEETIPLPTTLYGKSKLEGTQRLSQCCKNLGLKGLTARLFTVYGPGEHLGRLLPSLLEIANTGESLQLTAGLQKRDFTYVEDVAEGLIRLGISQSKPGEIVNLATGKLNSVRRFIETAGDILDIPPGLLEFGVLPKRNWEMEHDPVSIVRQKFLTGWTPTIGLSEGICRTQAFICNQKRKEMR